MQEVITGAGAAVVAWAATYLVGRPIVALQRQRIEVLQTAERYYTVEPSDDDSGVAVKALFEAGVAMRAYEKHTLDTMAHAIVTPYWYRIVMARSYVKGWKIGPSHFANQDLSSVWLDR